MNFVILAIIAILVLTLVIMFATGSFGRLTKQLRATEEAATPDEITTFRLGCEQACNANKLVKTEIAWRSSTYCTRTHYISEEEPIVHCWKAPLGVPCSGTVGGVAISEVQCPDYGVEEKGG